MLKRLVLTLAPVALVLVGCASNPKKIEEVAIEEAARLDAPSRSLDSYAEFELLPMTLGAEVEAEEAKVKYARDLEGRLRERLTPVLETWRAAGGGAGTLQIRPELSSLRIVSGGARFWAGAMAGDSRIDMDLVLIDEATGDAIARPRIDRNASGMAGGWSVGASDKNLLNYIVEIAAQFLESHHTATALVETAAEAEPTPE